MQEYGFSGVDIDLENGVNSTYMSKALRRLSAKAGPGLVLTMAPQTLDMQSTGTEYFKTALAVKDILTVVNMQYYNSGSMLGCDGQVYSQGSVDFLTALACIQLQGGLDPSQVGIGVPASSRGAGSGYVAALGGQQRAGLPHQGHQLRLLQALQDLPGPAGRHDLVHQLGRGRRQRVVRLRRSARTRPVTTAHLLPARTPAPQRTAGRTEAPHRADSAAEPHPAALPCSRRAAPPRAARSAPTRECPAPAARTARRRAARPP